MAAPSAPGGEQSGVDVPPTSSLPALPPLQLQRCQIKKSFCFVEFYDLEDAKEACKRSTAPGSLAVTSQVGLRCRSWCKGCRTLAPAVMRCQHLRPLSTQPNIDPHFSLARIQACRLIHSHVQWSSASRTPAQAAPLLPGWVSRGWPSVW